MCMFREALPPPVAPATGQKLDDDPFAKLVQEAMASSRAAYEAGIDEDLAIAKIQLELAGVRAQLAGPSSGAPQAAPQNPQG